MTSDRIPTIRLHNAAMSVGRALNGADRFIVRGELDLHYLLESYPAPNEVPNLGMLGGLLIPPYQREVLGGEKQASLRAYMKLADVPPVEYGVRGDDVESVGEYIFEVRGVITIIDGLQRTTAARAILLENQAIEARNRERGLRPGDADYEPVTALRLGVTLHVGTNEAEEGEMFEVYNFKQTTMSANILLRNMIGSNMALHTIAQLTNEAPDFVLYNRIQWSQRMATNELVSARTIVLALCALYGIGTQDTKVAASRLEAVVESIGVTAFTANMRAFFDIVNDTWPFPSTSQRRGTLQLKGDFLRALAQLFGQHKDFWKEEYLTISQKDRRKLAQFLLDQTIAQALKTTYGSQSIYRWLVEHMNKQRNPANKLQPR